MTEPVAPPAPATVPPFPALGSANFNEEAYNNGAAMPGVMENISQQVQAAYTNALSAKEKAEAAALSQSAATDQADLAMGYRNTANNAAATATTKRDEAVNAASTATTKRNEAVDAAAAAVPAAQTATQARADALAAAAAAQVFATQQLKASSTSNLVPGAGPKTFMVEPGRSFVKGMYLVATSTGAAVNQMSGPVDGYDGATGALTLAVDTFTGTAARADWVIGVAVAATAAGLPVVPVFENTVAVAGVCYQIAAPGITLTMPTVWAKGQRTAIVELIRNNQKYTVVWGCKLRGQTLGTRIYSATGVSSGVLEFQDNDKGLT